MKFNSQIVSSASGSIGGCTYSRNRSGQYIRRRAMPVNPGSAFAQVMTAFFASMVTRWTSVLTPAQRDLWDVWGLNTPQLDPLGAAINWTGQNAFISMNSARNQAGLSIIDDAPTLFSGCNLTNPVLTIASEATQRFTITYTATDEWNILDEGGMNVYMGRPQNPSLNYFKGPYRYCDTAYGDTAAPPASPFVSTAVMTPFPFVAGQRIFLQIRAVCADARISSVRRQTILAVA